MKNHVLALSLLFTAACVPFVATAEAEKKEFKATRVVTIDPQAIMQASEEWSDKIQAFQKEIEVESVALQKEMEDLQKKSQAPNPDMLALTKQKNSLDLDQKVFQNKIQQGQQALQGDMMGKVDTAVEVVAKAQNIDAVFPKFFYTSVDADITSDVIAEMNKEYQKAKKAAKFKKQSVKPDAAKAIG